jgi:orotidine-5'-phosphate decarboxylase
MRKSELINLIRKKRSFLCVGLDTDPEKIPLHLHTLEDPVFEFNKRIIDATLPYTVAYKPNLAFYESEGVNGWRSLEKTMLYLRRFKDSVFTIADAKRGDIGNTSERYARAFLAEIPHGLAFDAITVAPYMGQDSVKPFLKFNNKWVILLALTSNPGAYDFQTQILQNGNPLYEQVISTAKGWGTSENLMFVVGATKAEMLEGIRRIVPDHFLLIPGVGAQGGSFKDVSKYGMTKDCGLLVNSSRGIIYASGNEDFAEKAKVAAIEIQREMEEELIKYCSLK